MPKKKEPEQTAQMELVPQGELVEFGGSLLEAAIKSGEQVTDLLNNILREFESVKNSFNII